ncbi:uncharacterized protein LOC123527728 [Mercenaria mercenaria]|uniref:uncharacterized protein LOC123527728 n=1 Tax=Mercenaria mercenaria TaxID=6596 RepID=UPI00234EF29A|nr:uncharacterized protein LOC123527728 [Mercenaria mercenaria]
MIMMIQVSVAVVMVIVFGEANGGFKSRYGNSDEQNVCAPTYECKSPFPGHCQQLLCCQKETFSNSSPPVGDCICVTDLKYCEQLPFPYKRSGDFGASCVCCDCEERCVPLKRHSVDLELCPNFEAPLGRCDNNKNRYCCPSRDETHEACDCFQRCPKLWQDIGSCAKCCEF